MMNLQLKRKPITSRDIEITRLALEGTPLKTIANVCGLSPSRISGIVRDSLYQLWYTAEYDIPDNRRFLKDQYIKDAMNHSEEWLGYLRKYVTLVNSAPFFITMDSTIHQLRLSARLHNFVCHNVNATGHNNTILVRDIVIPIKNDVIRPNNAKDLKTLQDVKDVLAKHNFT